MPSELQPDRPEAAELPPVEPPTAGFIVQLFVIPAVVVVGVVMVWLLFGMIAASSSDPEDFVKALEGENREKRWRAAHDLAGMLQTDRGLAENAALAIRLTQLLQRELQRNEDAVVEQYLATALGWFRTPVGTVALREAIKPPYAREVRLAAILALGQLAQGGRDLEDPSVVPALAEVLADQDAAVRKTAVLALGAIGDRSARGALVGLLGDSDRETRYQTAAALAQLGDAAGLKVIAEMLDEPALATRTDLEPGERTHWAGLVALNGLRAVADLARKTDGASLDSLRPAVERLTESRTPEVKVQAQETLRVLHQGRAAGGQAVTTRTTAQLRISAKRLIPTH